MSSTLPAPEHVEYAIPLILRRRRVRVPRSGVPDSFPRPSGVSSRAKAYYSIYLVEIINKIIRGSLRIVREGEGGGAGTPEHRNSVAAPLQNQWVDIANVFPLLQVA